jgi:TonB family protein
VYNAHSAKSKKEIPAMTLSPALRLFLVLVWPLFSFGQEPSTKPLFVPIHEQQARIISGPPPAYPRDAAAQKIEGSIRIRFVVTKEGTVQDERVIIGNWWFISPAESALQSWRYRPALRDGSPIDVVTAVSFSFYLPGHNRDTYIEPYRQSVAKEPNDAKAHELLAEALHEIGEVDEAKQEYEAAVRLDPRFPGPHYGLSRIFQEREDYIPTISEYRKGVELEPRSQEAHLKFAGVLQDARAFDDAIAEYKKGRQLGPTDFSTYYSIGQCYVLKGDPNRAIPELQAALKGLKNFAFANYYLGQAYELKGDLRAALKQYQIASDQSKDNEMIRSAYQRLQQQLKK